MMKLVTNRGVGEIRISQSMSGYCYVDFVNIYDRNDVEGTVFGTLEEAFAFLKDNTHDNCLSVDTTTLVKLSDFIKKREVEDAIFENKNVIEEAV